ncbi:hypothetical protein OH492_28115 [Vibrio chagasii]|nr:hypothetical protein [Vibrio chagasii]
MGALDNVVAFIKLVARSLSGLFIWRREAAWRLAEPLLSSGAATLMMNNGISRS